MILGLENKSDTKTQNHLDFFRRILIQSTLQHLEMKNFACLLEHHCGHLLRAAAELLHSRRRGNLFTICNKQLFCTTTQLSTRGLLVIISISTITIVIVACGRRRRGKPFFKSITPQTVLVTSTILLGAHFIFQLFCYFFSIGRVTTELNLYFSAE